MTSCITFAQNSDAIKYYNKAVKLKEAPRDYDDLDKAVINLDKALKLSPNYIQALILRADITRMKGCDAAMEDINKAILLDSLNFYAYLVRGDIKTNDECFDIEGAMNDFNKSISINPNYSRAYISRSSGILLSNPDLIGNLNAYGSPQYIEVVEMAKADLTMAIELADYNITKLTAYYNRASLNYELLQDTISACKDWKEYKALGGRSNHFLLYCKD